jgi:cell division protein FtsB
MNPSRALDSGDIGSLHSFTALDFSPTLRVFVMAIMAAGTLHAAKLARLKTRIRILGFLNRVMFVALCGAAGFLVVAKALPQRNELVRLEKRLDEAKFLEREVAAEREQMRIEHRALREDPGYMEVHARDRLDLHLDGEKVLRFSRER